MEMKKMFLIFWSLGLIVGMLTICFIVWIIIKLMQHFQII